MPASVRAQQLESPPHRLGAQLHPRERQTFGFDRHAALLVRGADRYGHFEAAAWPKEELGEKEVATHERAMSLYRDAYLEEEARHAKLSA